MAWWERQPVAGTMASPLSLIVLYDTGGLLTALRQQRRNPMGSPSLHHLVNTVAEMAVKTHLGSPSLARRPTLTWLPTRISRASAPPRPTRK